MRIAFVGTGIMGASMIMNLMKAGHSLTVYNRTKSKADGVVAAGAVWKDSLAECVREAEAVITIIGFPKDVEEVYFGQEGILAHAPGGAILVDMTTTSPRLAKRIFEEAEKRGLQAIDAPVSGGDQGAREGTLSIMAGGSKEAYDQMLPVFQAMGSRINYMGPAGSGQHTKMANQIAIAGAISGVCEALTYSRKAGLDLEGVLACIGAGAASSWQMNNLGPKMVQGDDRPGFLIKHMLKDLKIALEEAEAENLDLPVLALVEGMYETLAAQGRQEEGTQALIHYFE